MQHFLSKFDKFFCDCLTYFENISLKRGHWWYNGKNALDLKEEKCVGLRALVFEDDVFKRNDVKRALVFGTVLYGVNYDVNMPFKKLIDKLK